MSTDGLYVQFGSGLSAPDGWISFDASPTLRIKRIPVIGNVVCRLFGINTPFPSVTRYGDIIQGLPIAANSADGVYASHVLEHLSLEDCKIALLQVIAMLKPGGRFRLIVPDMQGRAERYVAAAQSGDASAVHQLIDGAGVGHRTIPKTLTARARSSFGHTGHLWMWDQAAMVQALENAGFVGIRSCAAGDSEDRAFLSVEDPGRFVDDGIIELALEAVKPG